mgnify:CR=1 FL=1
MTWKPTRLGKIIYCKDIMQNSVTNPREWSWEDYLCWIYKIFRHFYVLMDEIQQLRRLAKKRYNAKFCPKSKINDPRRMKCIFLWNTQIIQKFLYADGQWFNSLEDRENKDIMHISVTNTREMILRGWKCIFLLNVQSIQTLMDDD